MEKFNKPATTIKEQLNLLQKRGMIVADEEKAKRYLRFIGYYHLRAYWIPFEDKSQTEKEHQFILGTKFEDILTLYIFDGKLRVLIFEAIEKIEVALRANWVNYMATKYHSHGYLNNNLYEVERLGEVKKLKKTLKNDVEYSKEKFIKHYKDKYTPENLPPVWMAVELFSFGQLSRWIKCLNSSDDRNEIAKLFSLDKKDFGNLLHHLNYIRNICAHHNRLWNRHMSISMGKMKKVPPELIEALDRENEHQKLYNTLVMLIYCVNIISPQSSWQKRLTGLVREISLESHIRKIPLESHMGFPENWKTYKFWKN